MIVVLAPGVRAVKPANETEAAAFLADNPSWKRDTLAGSVIVLRLRPRFGLPCVALGPLVEAATCACRREDVRTCLKGKGAVRQNVECERCGDYEADDESDVKVVRRETL